MKTIAPKAAVQPKHDASVASAAEQTSSASVPNPNGNPMSDMGEENPSEGLGYMDVHCEPSKPGKFDFGYMNKDTSESPMEVPVHAAGSYPVAEGREEPYAKPTHAPGTYAK